MSSINSFLVFDKAKMIRNEKPMFHFNKLKSSLNTLLSLSSHRRQQVVLFWLTIGALVNLSSCVPVKDMIYLQPAPEGPIIEVFTYENPNYKLQVNDILDVKISSLNPDINMIFNSSALGIAQVTQASAQTGGDLYYVTGYSISTEGDIDIPFVGKVKVAGLKLADAHNAVDEKVKKLFANYHLQVKLGGVRFSALGEFNRPGKHVVMQNQVTIFEAIALGGDLSPVANREVVKVIRQYPEGTRIHTINLLDQSVIESPCYFIQPNDVLYVEPLPQRAWGIGVTGSETLSTIISTLSTSLALTLSVLSMTR